MDNVVLIVKTNETTVKGALSGNKVLMVGRILNKREMAELLAATEKRVIMVGRIPNKREVEMSKGMSVMKVVNQSSHIKETEERVEIAKFFLRAQEERLLGLNNNKHLKQTKRRPLLKSLLLHNLQ